MMKSNFGALSRLAWACMCVLVAGPALVLQAGLADGIIPADRVIDWTQAGVPGFDAIRASRTMFTNVAGLDTNGVLDCSAAIQAAINNCPSNGIVGLPAGRLVISNMLYISANSLNRGGYMTLKGAGSGNTTILNRGSGPAFLTGNQNYGQSNSIVVSTLYQGTSNMIVGVTPDFEVNDVLMLFRQDEAATNFDLVFDNSGLTNSSIISTNGMLVGYGNWYRVGSGDVFSQLVRCTGISGTSISFWPPLYWSWTNTPGLYAYCKRVWGASALVGVESLTITNSSWVQATMKFNGTYGSWLKDCKVLGYGSPVVMFTDSLNCQVQGCDFSLNSANPPGGDVIGLEFNHCSAFKAEENTFSGYWVQMLLESSASGGVIAYNYFTNEYMAASAPAGYLQPDIYLCHEAHVMMNLLEGNILSGVQADNYHGSSSHNTFFRNWVHGTDHAFGYGLTNNIKCIDLCRYSYYYNIVGNVLGSPESARSGAFYQAPNDGTFGTLSPAMYRLGFPDMGNDCTACNDVYLNYQGANGTTVWGYPISFDPRVTNTLLRLNNYDCVTGGVPDGNTNLPPSLVYGASPPSWWPSTNTAPWPPIGPDLSPRVSVIPAQLRYNALPGPASNAAPTLKGFHIAAFPVAPNSGPVPLTVSVTPPLNPSGFLTQGTTNFLFDFGDGTLSSSVTHVYTSPGVYTFRGYAFGASVTNLLFTYNSAITVTNPP
jgi:hypothetical protein